MNETLLVILILACIQRSTTRTILISKQKDFNHNFKDPNYRVVPRMKSPGLRSNILLGSRHECIHLKSWISDKSRETNSSTKSHINTTPCKESEMKTLEEDSEGMQEFLIKYHQSDNIIKQCYNDTKCIYFGDCCPDKEQYSMDKTYKFYKCFGINTFYSTVNYLLVSKCSPFINNDTDTKKKCERDSNPEYPPVTSNDVGRCYRNEFCAKCNGEFEYTKWDTKIVIKDSDWFDQITHIRNLSDVTDFMKHRIQNSVNIFKIPAGMSEPWKCHKKYDYIDECNLTGLVLSFEPWEQIGCYSFTDPVGFYRNVYCKMCNWNQFCHLKRGSRDKSLSFGALMDLTALQKYEEYLKAKEKKNSCQADDFYDYLYVRKENF